MKVNIAIPVMDEMEWLPHTLESLSNQSLNSFKLWVCVNQPESWWSCAERRGVCESNAQLLKWLSSYTQFDCQVIDRSSKGRGWPDGRGGVGAARRVVMDTISESSEARDIIVSLDSDTLLDPGYLAEVYQCFADNPDAVGYTARYYHKLTGNQYVDRAVLRYEIYLRYYLINLQRVESPYAFTAMGSAFATNVQSYRKVGGMSPKPSAEDFYFLQKLAKQGLLIYGERSSVYPASRISERVIFGTGQAILNGFDVMRERYPIFESSLFDDIAETTANFGRLYEGDIELPLNDFLRKNLNCENLWNGLRRNHTSRERFVRGCPERVDGLRLFQYLRTNHNPAISDEESLFQAFNTVFAGPCEQLMTPAVHDILTQDLNSWSFGSASIDQLNVLRDFLMAIEDIERIRVNLARHSRN